MDLFSDKRNNLVIAMSGFFPLTVSADNEKIPPALGMVRAWCPDNSILTDIQEVPMFLSYN